MKYQSNQRSHPFYAFDPEIERQMAAHGVAQNDMSKGNIASVDDRFISGTKVPGNNSDKNKSRHTSPRADDNSTEQTGVWDKSGFLRLPPQIHIYLAQYDY